MRYPGYAYGAATDARTTEATDGRREAKYKCSEPRSWVQLDDRGVRII